jgi:hypothetical protein
MTAKIKEHKMNIVEDILASDDDMSEFEIPFCPPSSLPTRILEEGEIEENDMVKCSCRRFHYNEFCHLVCSDCGVARRHIQHGHHRFKGGIKKRSTYEESRRNYNITRW